MCVRSTRAATWTRGPSNWCFGSPVSCRVGGVSGRWSVNANTALHVSGRVSLIGLVNTKSMPEIGRRPYNERQCGLRVAFDPSRRIGDRDDSEVLNHLVPACGDSRAPRVYASVCCYAFGFSSLLLIFYLILDAIDPSWTQL